MADNSYSKSQNSFLNVAFVFVANGVINYTLTPYLVSILMSNVDDQIVTGYLRTLVELSNYFTLCFLVNIVTVLTYDFLQSDSVENNNVAVATNSGIATPILQSESKVFWKFFLRCFFSWFVALNYFRTNTKKYDASDYTEYSYYLMILLATFFNHIFHSPISYVVITAWEKIREIINLLF